MSLAKTLSTKLSFSFPSSFILCALDQTLWQYETPARSRDLAVNQLAALVVLFDESFAYSRTFYAQLPFSVRLK